MATEKRYYWLRLKEDFFSSKRVKKLRQMAGGDTYLIIYLKLQLKAMKQDGIIKFDHLESTIAEELALDLDESVDNVKVTLAYLVSCGLAETNDETSYIFLPYAVENVGSEGASAKRMREARDKTKHLPQAEIVTLCAQSSKMCKKRYGEKEIEKEIEIEQEQEEVVGVVDDPDGVQQIARDHSEILDAAEAAGFPKNSATWNKIIDLYTEYGKAVVLAGISACVEQSVTKPAYLRKCCANIASGEGKAEKDPLLPKDHEFMGW